MNNLTAVRVARVLLGLTFFTFGLNGFFGFMPVPPARPDAERFIVAIIDTGYLFQLVKGLEVSSGALLLLGRYVPLALVLLAPLLVGITSIHLWLNPEGLPVMAVIGAVYGYLIKAHWAAFRPLVAAEHPGGIRPELSLGRAA